MFCPKCGKENVDTAAFCIACGNKISQDNSTVQEKVEVQEKPTKVKLPGLILAFVLGLIAFLTQIISIIFLVIMENWKVISFTNTIKEAVNNSLLIFGVILVILAIIVIVFSIIGLVLGSKALKTFKLNPTQYQGKGYATAGKVFCILSLAIYIIPIIILIWLLF